MEREHRPLALRTASGPVDLRPPRQESRITTNEGASTRTIKKGWLKDTQGDASYQKAVKQANTKSKLSPTSRGQVAGGEGTCS
mmetsp:Transcript_34283/g.54855  ORF Transcript_34283/g.54855 Transcript_34283/m.54855 type:complete len:83 (+) Transcript_34283:72-320(+)